MSAPQWRPGDVALVDSWRGKGQLAFRCERVKDEPTWCVSDGHDSRGLHDREVTNARPVVVIDPEDREQVERLVEALRQRDFAPYNTWAVTQATDALHSLIAPPRPEEPQGLGAVVEDSTGGVWVRAEATVMNCWTNGRTGERVMWHKIDGPRLLSEGWRADA